MGEPAPQLDLSYAEPLLKRTLSDSACKASVNTAEEGEGTGRRNPGKIKTKSMIGRGKDGGRGDEKNNGDGNDNAATVFIML